MRSIPSSRRTVLAGVAAAIGLGLAGLNTAQAQTDIKFGHVGNPGSLFEASANEFARIANAKLGNKAKVTVYGSSQLGGDKEMVQKLKLGTLDFALPSSVMTSEVDLFGIFDMPYLVANRDHMKRIEKEVVRPTLFPMAEQKGLKILSVWENGYRHITNNKRPIVSPADLQGVKLRTPQGKWRVKMFQAYGANPTPMSFSEVFTALQTGVMDGQENPLTQIYSGKFQEVQKYLSMSGHVYTPAFPTASVKRFNSYPADVQKALIEAAIETQDFVFKTAAKMDNELLDKVKAAGTKVNDVDSKAFVAASKAIYEEFGQDVKGGNELISKAQSLR